MKTKWVGFVVVMCFILGLSAAGWAASYKPEYKLSVVVAPTSPWGQGAQLFADLVKQKSDGRINIKCYFSGGLFAGKQMDEFLLLKQGAADFAVGSTINWSTSVKELNLFSLPFFFHDYKALDAVETGVPGGKIIRHLEKEGVIALGWGENGFREITNGKRAIKKPEDLEGLKVRVAGSPIFIDIFKALGADPVSMNWGDAVNAFQSGAVDGQENPVTSIIIPYKLWQVHKYATIWHYAIDPLIFGVSKATWNSFNARDRKILRKAAAEAAIWQKKAAREGLEGSTAAIDVLKKSGMDVTVLSPADMKIFRARMKPVYDKWIPEIGAGLVNAAEKAIKGAPKKAPAARKSP